MVLVVASEASAVSKWVGLELEVAREYGKPILPFFIESVDRHERFRDHLGVDATLPQAFDEGVHQLMRDLFLSFDQELPPADRTVLEAGLRELAREEPDLAPLINGCLDSEGLHRENMETAYKSSFHPLDHALNALFDLNPNTSTADHAAYGFRWAGAGTRALSSWIAATGDGALPFETALTGRLEPALIPTAIRLLAACDPPNNSALYSFIDHNAAQLDQDQRRSVIRLVTWPLRKDTARSADVLGEIALKHFPDNEEIQQMWSRWIRDGAFDGRPNTQSDLAHYLADAHKEGLSGWEPVNEALRRHVKEYLRSGDKNKIVIAMDYVQAAAEKGAPVLQLLLSEAEGCRGTAEWETWEEQDPESAEFMRWYVLEVSQEATGDRNWLRAWDNTEKMVTLQKRRRQILEQNKDESDERNG